MIRGFGQVSGLSASPTGLDTGIASGGSNIKSIQSGFTDLGAASVKNIPISAVDVNKTVVIITMSAGGNPSNKQHAGKLTSATNLELSLGGLSNGYTVYYQIIEFKSIKSLQKGTAIINTSANNLDVTINQVDLGKSVVYYSYKNTDPSTSSVDVGIACGFASSTGIKVWSNFTAASRTITVEWQVVEFE